RWAPAPVAVLCGPGDNGGDGYVAARVLREAGWPVRVLALKPAGSQASRAAAQAWGGEIAGPEAAASVLADARTVVDALFGAGLSRPLDDDVRQLLAQAAEGRRTLVAVDLPSGLQGDSGEAHEGAPQAALTVTFAARKRAHVLEPASSLCGEIVVADIGLGPHLPPADPPLWVNEPALWADRFPWPAPSTYKNARGALLVVSGGAHSTGAARLAARAGLRVGAGLSTVMSPPSALLVNACALEAVMVRPFANAAALGEAAAKAQAVVIGPAAGVGERTAANLQALAATGARLVVDADALTSFKADPAALFALLDADDVITPHPGEFERVFPGLLEESPERIAAAREAARRAGCVVLLKGGDTVVAHPDGRAAVSTVRAPWLATAGSGDTLAGMIGGLLAQGMASFDAACTAVWMHAEAGRRHGPGLISEDLAGLIPAVLRDLHDRRPAAG
ncbi:MAG: NAD(P)H-hydrate dehydratase, partial [Caulobacteraceae bacterium]|nr:NAD(P)H-hydrate dehydratase [Caulobacter sp.]